MKPHRSFTAPASKFLTPIVFVGITLLLMWEYRVTRASQQGMADRIAHQNEETADLIIKAITRDMRGAQIRILANRDWDAPPPIGLALDLTEQVATTFARYPYPESFFTWGGGTHGMVFFSRATRLPQWMPPPSPALNSPIVMAVDPSIADEVRQRLLPSVAAQLRYSAFDMDLAGVPYQVIARITYADPLREHLESVSGFTVNLAWVREWYFADILSEVKPSASGSLTQDVALLDEHNRTVMVRTAQARRSRSGRFRCSSWIRRTRRRICRRIWSRSTGSCASAPHVIRCCFRPRGVPTRRWSPPASPSSCAASASCSRTAQCSAASSSRKCVRDSCRP